ncbi:GNAT family N-acetyltransferase [bacterium]|nr:GNAT family N-acetyltransferase [bacterium]
MSGAERDAAWKLVLITRDGTPGEPLRDLPAEAAEVLDSMRVLYRQSGYVPPWVGYLAVEEGACVGTCAFKTSPIRERVEIAYFTFPPHEGRGVATRMARALVGISRRTDPEVVVTARTLPERNASTSVLARIGFVFDGEIDDPEDGIVWEWRLPGGVSGGAADDRT